MKTIEIQFDINDIVYRADGNAWDVEMNNYRNYVVGKYIVRSISISCNSKGEWKRSYRVQQEINGRIIGYGFNFRDEDSLNNQARYTQVVPGVSPGGPGMAVSMCAPVLCEAWWPVCPR